MNEQTIIERINKLMRLAEKAGTPEEAELAFAKAQELMVKHAIDSHRLREAGQAEDDPIVVWPIRLGNRDEIKRSKLLLYMRVAEANQCKVLDATQGYDEVRIVGHRSSAQFVEILVASILMQYASERTREWKSYQARYGGRPPQSRFKWVNGFSWGYAQRIGERIASTQRKAEAKTTGAELVLRDKKADVEDWMSENMNVRKGRRLSVRASWDSQHAGRESANRADISGGRNNVSTRGGRALR